MPWLWVLVKVWVSPVDQYSFIMRICKTPVSPEYLHKIAKIITISFMTSSVMGQHLAEHQLDKKKQKKHGAHLKKM